MSITAEIHSNTQYRFVASTENPLILQFGRQLEEVIVAYETYGKLNAQADNAVLVCHALTGNAHVADLDIDGQPSLTADGQPRGWWNGLIGKGKIFDPSEHFIICSNVLGGCYGTTGPRSIDPNTGERYGTDFPTITVRDMVAVQYRLLQQLGVRRLDTVIGASLGGMQVLEWGAMHGDIINKIVPIATSARHSAWAIGLNETARLAIQNDPAWLKGDYTDQPESGLSLARMIAMVTYRSHPAYEKRFGREENGGEAKYRFKVENYLRYQGRKLVKRFDANTYLTITRAMDAHDLKRDRNVNGVLPISCEALCIGISSDVLYPPEEQRDIVESIPGAHYAEIDSIHGHDAFLIEFEQLAGIIEDWVDAGVSRE
ncbi:MAG: homoserine O-acetyltransferase MetX [Calditrichia bacterium]